MQENQAINQTNRKMKNTTSSPNNSFCLVPPNNPIHPSIHSSGQLSVPWRLCGPWQAIVGGRLPPLRLQDQVSRKLLPLERESRVRRHQQNLRILRRMPPPLLSQNVEAILQHLQLPPLLRRHRRQDHLHARWSVARALPNGTDREYRTTMRCP